MITYYLEIVVYFSKHVVVIYSHSGPHCNRMVTPERQRLLQEQYFFLCQCEACSPALEDGAQQQSGVGGSQHESGLLCGKCKGSLTVRVNLA